MAARPARLVDGAGQASSRWLVLGPHAGLRFLDLWHAWRADAQRPAMLHVLAVGVGPDIGLELLAQTQTDPAQRPLAEAVARQCWGLHSGFHRLSFEDDRVLLTLGVGPIAGLLRAQSGLFDAVEIAVDLGTEAAPGQARAMVRSIARLCREGALLELAASADRLRPHLVPAGFVEDALRPDVYRLAPAWGLPGRAPAPPTPSDCTVIGAGLAGAAVAASLARRGWSVQVLDAATAPAAGASAVPAGMLAPHHSPDDNLLSRLSRAGVRMTLQQAQALLQSGRDWEGQGALEIRSTLAENTPWAASLPDWNRPANRAVRAAARIADDAQALWHARAAWIRPQALVQAWLAQPRVRWRGGARVERLVQDGGQWHVLDASGQELSAAPLVVLCAGTGIATLHDRTPTLQPVRGQLSWGPMDGLGAMPAFPINGDGHLLAGVPVDGAPAWMCGSSYDRGDTDLSLRTSDHAANLERLERILPAIAHELTPQFDTHRVRGWTGIRCSSADRRPIVGPLASGLWLSTALGSRGLTFAALCGELLAARLHGEPLPLAQPLAKALDSARFRHPPICGPISR